MSIIIGKYCLVIGCYPPLIYSKRYIMYHDKPFIFDLFIMGN